MRAIILAAGRGRRMNALTNDRPKCLVEFRGKPLLQWQIDALAGAGVHDIAVVRGYRGDLLEPFGLTMFDNPRWAETQMVSSLACAAEWLRTGACLVSYSDIFYSADSVERLLASPAELSLLFDPNWLEVWQKRFADPLDDAETFRIGPDGRVLEIGKKTRNIEDIQGQYVGLLRFAPGAWQAVEALRASMEPAVRDRIDMTSTLQRLIETGFPVFGVPMSSSWGEIDSDEDLVRQR